MSSGSSVWSRLKVDSQGLIPAVVQDWRDGTVLMVGFMSEEAFERTLTTNRVHFWSRSRQELWEKGRTSGHYLTVKDVLADCDQDVLLVKSEPVGPTCHTGRTSCFFTPISDLERHAPTPSPAALGGLLEQLYRTIIERKEHPKKDSYVSSLFVGGQDRILKKVVEEAGEVLLASKNQTREEMIYETADLMFHMLVALAYHNIALRDVYDELGHRFGKPGRRPQHERTNS